jgi:hypothetical protein
MASALGGCALLLLLVVVVVVAGAWQHPRGFCNVSCAAAPVDALVTNQ